MSNDVTPRVESIRSAALSFARDHGPIAAATSGNSEARHEVATRLVRALRKHGLKIVEDSKASS